MKAIAIVLAFLLAGCYQYELVRVDKKDPTPAVKYTPISMEKKKPAPVPAQVLRVVPVDGNKAILILDDGTWKTINMAQQ